jgi:hypothetical protein
MRDGDLTGRDLRFVVGQANREHHLPSAAPRQFAERLHLRWPDRARGPRRSRRGRVGPTHVLVGRDAAEAQLAWAQ